MLRAFQFHLARLVTEQYFRVMTFIFLGWVRLLQSYSGECESGEQWCLFWLYTFSHCCNYFVLIHVGSVVQVLGRWNVNQPTLAILCEEAQRLIQNFSEFSVRHVDRVCSFAFLNI